MTRTLITFAAGIGLGAIGMAATFEGSPGVVPLAERDIVEKLDGKAAKATVVEVTLNPGQAGMPHRHPGPAFGYVLEGEYEWAIDDQPAKVLKVGETFYEPTRCLHRVSKNPSARGRPASSPWSCTRATPGRWPSRSRRNIDRCLLNPPRRPTGSGPIGWPGLAGRWAGPGRRSGTAWCTTPGRRSCS